MSKIYKKVWNKLRGCYVAVSEALGSKQSRGSTAVAVVITAVSAVTANPAFSKWGPIPAGLVVSNQVIYCERDYYLTFRGAATVTKTGLLVLQTYGRADFPVSGSSKVLTNNGRVLFTTHGHGWNSYSPGYVYYSNGAKIINNASLWYGSLN